MTRFLQVLLVLVGLASLVGRTVAAPPMDRAETDWPEVDLAAPPWAGLAAGFVGQGDTSASFTETRVFAFRKQPTVLRGQVRVSPALGLSLHYTHPEQRTLILDERGVLLRGPDGDAVPPDARSAAANAALWRVFRFDFSALARDFRCRGWAEGDEWILRLEPRDAALRRSVGEMVVMGAGAVVRHLELRRGERQRIVIAVADVQSAEFSAEDRRRYFRPAAP